MTLTSLSFRALACAGVLCLAAGARAASEPSIIAKARARLGPDAVLDAVKSIHYTGTIVGPDANTPDKEVTRSIEIILQKPDQQRIVIKSDKVVEVSALDGYEAWRRVTDATDQTKWQQNQLGPDQVKQLRADVWENLGFFRGIEKAGGSMQDLGPATVDGVACEKVAFNHGSGIVYYRYFDRATGDLVNTTTGNEDNSIRERGEIVAGGIHFPKTILVRQTANGRETARTITFDKVILNESFPDSLFAVPLPMIK